MDKKIKVIENGKVKQYNILLEFSSDDTNKKYIFCADTTNDKIYISYYKKKNDLYILMPIENQEEIEMCMNILKDIREYQ